jgi:hypothetical protein
MADEIPEVVIGAEKPYFCFSATLRIWGDVPDLGDISRRLGLEPTHAHRKGEKRGPRSPGYRHDHWSYKAPVAEERPLEEHILALWEAIRQHVDYLKSLKETLNVDVFCGYRSNSQTAGFQVGHGCLEMFVRLEVPFGVSVIVLPD